MDEPGISEKRAAAPEAASSTGPATKRTKSTGASGYVERRKATRIDYVQSIGQARALDHLQKWIREYEYGPKDIINAGRDGSPTRSHKWYLDMDTGCWILTSGLTSKGTAARQAGAPRYGLAKLYTNDQLEGLQAGRHPGKNAHVNFQWHVLAYLAQTGKNVEGDCSHLCGVSQCFNPTHLVDEDHQTNLDRRYCVGDIWCTKHDHLVVDLCRHEPKCIKPFYRDDLPPVRCCRSLSPPSQENPFVPASQVSEPSQAPRDSSPPSAHGSWGNLESQDIPQSDTESQQQSPKTSQHQRGSPEQVQDILSQDPTQLPGTEQLQVAMSMGEAKAPEVTVDDDDTSGSDSDST